MPKLLGLVLASLLFLTIGSGCGPDPGPTAPPYNLLLVSVDTLRADRLGCYGGPAGSTPVMDEVAENGIRFHRAWAPAPLTLPSHASLLTGLRPSRHGLRNNGPYPLPKAIPTLATALSSRGYDCRAVVGAAPLDRRFGLDRGFKTYDGDFVNRPGDPHYAERTGTEVVQRALRHLKDHSADDPPFFLFVHLFDPHAPYDPPSRFRGLEGSDYQGEVRYVDYCIGRLLETLANLDLERRTLVAITADHGESLGEHGEATHAHLLYESTLRVPLLLSQPGVLAQGEVIQENVSLIDLPPTLLGLALGEDQKAIDLLLPNSDGWDLRAELAPSSSRERLTERPIYSETLYGFFHYRWAASRAVLVGNSKAIRSGEHVELYDLASDPGEHTNLALASPPALEPLTELLDREEAQSPLHPLSAAISELPRLHALGYLEPSPDIENPQGPTREQNRSLPAPIERIQVTEKLNGALAARTVDSNRALALATEACLLDPLNPEAHFVRGLVLRETANRLGRAGSPDREHNEAAVEALRRSLELRPNHDRALLMLGSAVLFSSDEGSVSWTYRELESLVDRDPAQGEAAFVLGFLLDIRNPAGLGEREKVTRVRDLLERVVPKDGPDDDLAKKARAALRSLPARQN